MIKWQHMILAPKDGRKILAWIVREPDEYCRAVGEPNGWEGPTIIYWNDELLEWEHEGIGGVPTAWAEITPPNNAARLTANRT